MFASPADNYLAVFLRPRYCRALQHCITTSGTSEKTERYIDREWLKRGASERTHTPLPCRHPTTIELVFLDPAAIREEERDY